MGTCIEALARQALATPAIDASDAMDVLVDALLEADVVRDDGLLRASHETGFAGLRRKAFEWARRRLCRNPNPMQTLVELVATALDERGLPPAVVGVVRPSLIRIHLLSEVDAHTLELAREAVQGRIPGSVVIETTCCRAR